MCSHLFIFNLWAVNELLIIAYLGQWIHSNWCVFFHGIHYIHPLVWIRKNVPILDALRPGYHRIGRKRLQHHHRWSSQNHAYKSINGVTRVSSRFGVVTYRDSAFRSSNKEEHQKMNSVCVWDASEYKQNIAKWKHTTTQWNAINLSILSLRIPFHCSVEMWMYLYLHVNIWRLSKDSTYRACFGIFGAIYVHLMQRWYTNLLAIHSQRANPWH